MRGDTGACYTRCITQKHIPSAACVIVPRGHYDVSDVAQPPPSTRYASGTGRRSLPGGGAQKEGRGDQTHGVGPEIPGRISTCAVASSVRTRAESMTARESLCLRTADVDDPPFFPSLFYSLSVLRRAGTSEACFG